MPLVDLLQTAAPVQRHSADGPHILEIRLVRIVESDMAVFSEPEKRDVERRCRDKLLVAQAFRVDVGRLTVQLVHRARTHPLDHLFERLNGINKLRADFRRVLSEHDYGVPSRAIHLGLSCDGATVLPA